MIKKGTWVCVFKTILEPGERAEGIPADTAKTPLRMWVCGFLEEDAVVGDEVKIRTKMNRLEEGRLEEANPATAVNFGNFVPEILQIGIEARRILNDDGNHIAAQVLRDKVFKDQNV